MPTGRQLRRHSTGNVVQSVPAYAERVLAVVESIPAGLVMSYGDIAEYVGDGGPRQVGRVMSQWGGGVPWHRVVHADGSPATCHDGQALRLLRAEGTPLRGTRVDMRAARWFGPRHLNDG